MKRVYGFVGLVITALFLTPASTRADGFISPTIGVNFGGSAGGTLRSSSATAVSDGRKINWGVAAGWMGKGIVGVEEDFQWSPDFFGHGGSVDSSRVVTVMTNLIVGAPIGGEHGGGIRPYASLGVGWINQNISNVNNVNNFTENDFGWDLGGGVMGYFSDNVGLRFDYRYLRNFQETTTNTIGLEVGHFAFQRASVGVLFRF
jgi:opacity protein-like surface antigen